MRIATVYFEKCFEDYGVTKTEGITIELSDNDKPEDVRDFAENWFNPRETKHRKTSHRRHNLDGGSDLPIPYDECPF